MLESMTELRRAVEVVRAQIPRGELTRASVERLLAAAEAVCAGVPDRTSRPSAAAPARASKRQQTRARWAEIARENEQEQRQASVAAE